MTRGTCPPEAQLWPPWVQMAGWQPPPSDRIPSQSCWAEPRGRETFDGVTAAPVDDKGTPDAVLCPRLSGPPGSREEPRQAAALLTDFGTRNCTVRPGDLLPEPFRKSSRRDCAGRWRKRPGSGPTCAPFSGRRRLGLSHDTLDCCPPLCSRQGSNSVSELVLCQREHLM